MEFTYEVIKDEDYTIINLIGNLITDEQLRTISHEVNTLIESKNNCFIINLAKVKYMNSTGLNLLIKILTKSRNAGGETIISEIPERIKKLILISKLNNVFSVIGSTEDAINILNKEKSCL